MVIINNDNLLRYADSSYGCSSVKEIKKFLSDKGTFLFPMLDSGLFPAAHLSKQGDYTGYDKIWVRDNVHVAHAHFVNGQIDIAIKNVQALLLYFSKQRDRWIKAIHSSKELITVNDRPHIKFEGKTMEDLEGEWSHAQNDALGYFLWLYCKLALAGHIRPDKDSWDILGWFVQFFENIRYWEDEDSGHWEEARKVEASSIGVVVAALTLLQQLLDQNNVTSFTSLGREIDGGLINGLLVQGKQALNEILPDECIQPGHERPYDSALLFLIYPLDVVAKEIAEIILENVEIHLKGAYGIKRYLNDSYWCANYDELLPPEERTINVSENMSERDALVKSDEEAQWCIFDPIMSVIYGKYYEATGDKNYYKKQIHYFNRSLGQLTGADSGFQEFLCPELYYLKGKSYRPNDATPLLWTQANLMLAFHQLEVTAKQ
ncbi:phosphorylase kinase alpha/beta subunit [Thiothrix caldifontis]|uniref:Phosphorylase kinase alpha/beta subunit n=1 Tax=Thiothrix caldifontis TaxID=525918 RepID=A0A1H4GDS2_9GAMM|nr:glycoside hydrolase family 15 protein [Thiothrix caldifontis]SEB07765.1 phosphorylase kinase alpha/beta subunit [Thiothrix caldifontis]